ncbi:response regulator [Cohnella thailandensis]|uniref:Response regulator n=1 Tax=Cohnella thailandensis TaxID=557557 RepID=A0A841SYZ3_9BACL|nr:response regulator [Cohnella thailandensis]MBB6637423.1 response regulator [Cohnella thailandensis]MBP1976753.1 two-component system chemotaxis response regulator CheY [Cohnella thailandensis]
MARILIADDAPIMRELLASLLIKGGHEIAAEARNGLEAVELYLRHRPELITMDITMPVMDGITAIRHIREKDPSAKIVIFSSLGQQNMIADAIRAGAWDFVAKPFYESRVLDVVSKALAIPSLTGETGES